MARKVKTEATDRVSFSAKAEPRNGSLPHVKIEPADGALRSAPAPAPASSSATRSGRLVQRASQPAPSKRPLTAASASGSEQRTAAAAKRARVVGKSSTAASSSSAASAAASASQRLWSNGKVVTHIIANLQYERIDLYALAAVSKPIRAQALPHIVERMNVRLTRAKQALAYLKANPGIIEHVKFLRIEDDIARHNSSYEIGLSPEDRQQDAPRGPIRMWADLGDLLLAFQNRAGTHGPPPLLELVFGQLDLDKLGGQLERTQPMLTRLASLRIVADLNPWRHTRSGDEIDWAVIADIYKEHGTKLSTDLSRVLELLCNSVQPHREEEDAGAVDEGESVFTHFAFQPFQFDEDRGIQTLPTLSAPLLKRFARLVRQLYMRWDNLCEKDFRPLLNLLRADWPRLRHCECRIDSIDHQWREDVWAAVLRFSKRHKEITNLETCFDLHADSLPPAWSLSTMPNLKSLLLTGLDNVDDSEQVHFAERHPKLKALSWEWMMPGTGLTKDANLVKDIRYLDGPAVVIGGFLNAGARPGHVRLEVREDDDHAQFPRCLLPNGTRVADFLTCLEYEAVDMTFAEFLRDFDTFVPLRMLPNLLELGLYVGWSYQAAAAPRKPSSAAVKDVAKLLDRLSSDDANRNASPVAPRLTAVQVRCVDGPELPDGAGDTLDRKVVTLPPRLMYLSWYDSFNSAFTHFRVLRDNFTGGGGVGAVRAGRSRDASLRSQTQASTRFQQLPASFRPGVAASGVWQGEPWERWTGQTLFEHVYIGSSAAEGKAEDDDAAAGAAAAAARPHLKCP